MGSCQTGCFIKVDNYKGDIVFQEKTTKKDIKEIDFQKEEFPDLEEWEGDRYKGLGIKKMKGYKCNLPIDKLNQKREEFWLSKIDHNNSNYKIWRIIYKACMFDEERAKMLLDDYDLKTYESCINHILDKRGNHYYIPNYCINDPYFEREFKINKNIESKNIKIKIFEPLINIKTDLKVNTLMSGEELKKRYCENLDICPDDYTLRFFFGGQEIKDKNFLYQYKLEKGFKIHAMKFPKINTYTKN